MKHAGRKLWNLVAGVIITPKVKGQLSGLLVIVSVTPLCSEAATLTVNCDVGDKIQLILAGAKPGDEIMVSGMCKEHVVIFSETVRITLNGQSKATIQATDFAPGTPPTFPIFIRGKEITIKGFTTVGGFDGIHLSGAAAGASAIIDGNVIRATRRFGIHVDSGSVAQIANNRIENVGSTGIDITEHSVARIGFLIPAAPRLGPNIMHNSGGDGIVISRASSAWIIGNTISDNKGSGISVTRNSQADILANSINSNGGDAITAIYSSAINLSSEDVPSRREGFNNTDAQQKNAGFGIRCTVGGHVAGPLGTLAGSKGVKEFDSTCVDKGFLP